MTIFSLVCMDEVYIYPATQPVLICTHMSSFLMFILFICVIRRDVTYPSILSSHAPGSPSLCMSKSYPGASRPGAAHSGRDILDLPLAVTPSAVLNRYSQQPHFCHNLPHFYPTFHISTIGSTFLPYVPRSIRFQQNLL